MLLHSPPVRRRIKLEILRRGIAMADCGAPRVALVVDPIDRGVEEGSPTEWMDRKVK
jgi:hypothetical protein